VSKKKLGSIEVILAFLFAIFQFGIPAFTSDPFIQSTWYKIITILLLVSFLIILVILMFHYWDKLRLYLFLKTDFTKLPDSTKTYIKEKIDDFRKKFEQIEGIVDPDVCRVQFTSDFIKYCNLCSKMLEKAQNKETDKILTVQTPVPMDSMSDDERKAFDDYISKTIEKIIETDITYKRIVVLKDDDDDPEQKIKDFVKKLISEAIRRESKGDINVDLSNTFIGFAHISKDAPQIYGNLDIHITTDKDFSIAFLCKTSDRESDFGGSLALSNYRGNVGPKLKTDITNLWDNIKKSGDSIGIFEYYPAYTIGKSAPKKEEEQQEIISKINEKIDEIVRKLKSP
jgi:hypothetical protein